jgi:hypothetical protein
MQWAFIVRNKQPDTGCDAATFALPVLDRIAGASALNRLGRSWTLGARTRVAAHAVSILISPLMMTLVVGLTNVARMRHNMHLYTAIIAYLLRLN